MIFHPVSLIFQLDKLFSIYFSAFLLYWWKFPQLINFTSSWKLFLLHIEFYVDRFPIFPLSVSTLRMLLYCLLDSFVSDEKSTIICTFSHYEQRNMFLSLLVAFNISYLSSLFGIFAFDVLLFVFPVLGIFWTSFWTSEIHISQ